MPQTPPSSSANTRPNASGLGESARSARRKRTFDDLYPSGSRAHFSSDRPSTAPEVSQQRQSKPNMAEWERHGFARTNSEGPRTPNMQTVSAVSDGLDIKPQTAKSTQEASQDPLEGLEDYNWDELEARYSKAMDERADVETKIFEEFAGLMEVSHC